MNKLLQDNSILEQLIHLTKHQWRPEAKTETEMNISTTKPPISNQTQPTNTAS